MNSNFATGALVAALLASPAVMAQDAAPKTVEDLWKIIQEQQKEIEALKQQNSVTEEKVVRTEEKLAVTEQQVAATGEYLEELEGGSMAGDAWYERTQLGGYGELHYNNLSAEDSEFDKKEVDFHRFVLFINHQFNDRLRLFTELELEHALSGDGKDGEVELEQAYIEYDIDNNHRAQGGVFLLPIGMLNETHEPPTFYGVERNDVENIIIPTTWWEAGAQATGAYASGFSWNFAVHSGLEMDDFRVRSGRQKVSFATANDLAYTGRVRYTGIPGLDLAASVQYQVDPSQGENNDAPDEGLLWTTHADWRYEGFGLKALYAAWDFEGDAIEAADRDDQTGWYVEPSYRFDFDWGDLGFYARFEDIEGGRDRDQFEQWEVGVNYWPDENVVIKADYRDREHDIESEQGRDFDGFDLGIGYQF